MCHRIFFFFLISSQPSKNIQTILISGAAQKQAAGQSWPVGCNLLALVYEKSLTHKRVFSKSWLLTDYSLQIFWKMHLKLFFFLPGHVACGILGPQVGIEPDPPVLEAES